MLQQLRSLLKPVILQATILFSLMLMSWVVPQPALAYSLEDLKEKAIEAKATITETASYIGKTAVQTATSTSVDIGNKVSSTSKVTLNESIQFGTKVGSTALEMGKNATHKVWETNTRIANTALKAGEVVTEIAISVSEEIGDRAFEVEKITVETAENLGYAATQKTVFLAEQAVTGVKSASFTIARQITQAFKQYAQPLLETAISQVDVNQLEAVIRQVQQEVSEHTPEALAKEFIARKVAESIEVESWAETARLQAEMIYQIAAAYGFELHSTARKQEILDIAAANLGSGELLKTSVPLIKYAVGQIPVAGDVLGVAVDWGSDRLIRSLMFPLLGQAACNYYTNLSLSLVQPALALQNTSDAS